MNLKKGSKGALGAHAVGLTPMNCRPPVTGSEKLSLTFLGLDLCDGCGIRLERGELLAGLCDCCQDRPKEAKREA